MPLIKHLVAEPRDITKTLLMGAFGIPFGAMMCFAFLDDPHSNVQVRLPVAIGMGILTALAIMVGFAVYAGKLKKLIGIGAFVSPEGVGALVDGEPTWMLSWGEYGGARSLNGGNYDILNREGIAVGRVCLRVNSSRSFHSQN